MTYTILRGPGGRFQWDVWDADGNRVDGVPPSFPTREAAVENVKLVHPKAKAAKKA